MRRRVAWIHRPSRAARPRPAPSPLPNGRSRDLIARIRPAAPAGLVGTRGAPAPFVARIRRARPAQATRTMSTAASFATVAPRARASTVVAALGTPAPSSSSSSNNPSFRPRLIRNAPVFAAPVAPAAMDAAVERLKTGFEKFKTEVYDKKPEVFEPLKAGQAPKYMVFACSDSRVCPSVTLGLEPGEAFTVRNIASMVPPYDKNKYSGVGSAIEYAVCALKVGVIVVIGHSRCGGIKALLSLQDGAPDAFHFVEDWVRIGFPAKKKVQTECASLPFDDQCGVLEKAAVNTSLENLKTYPFVTEGLANGTLKLVGAHYDFVSGKFDTWEN